MATHPSRGPAETPGFARDRVRAAALLVAIAAATASGPAAAAPLPPFPPVDVCGTIVERGFVAAEFRKGRPGFSGSLGHDRTIPAHVRVVLADWSGVDARTARRINFLQGAGGDGTPARLVLKLPTADPGFLAGVRAICVEGFRISGDEGGTWTRYGRVVPKARD